MPDNPSPLFPRWRDLLVVNPHGGAHWPMLKVALAVAAPLLGLWAIGRSDLTVYAVFAAYAAAFGREEPHRRLGMQLTVGLTLLFCIAIGAFVSLSPARGIIIVPIAAVIAFVMTVLGTSVRWSPPGALFHVFAMTAVAAAPGHPAQIMWGLLAAIGTLCWALLVTAVFDYSAIRRARLTAAPHRLLISIAPRVWQDAAVIAVGVLLAGSMALLLGIGHPYWGMVTVVAMILGPSVYHRMLRATHRFIGTILGLIVGAGILMLHPSGLGAIILVIVLQAGIELVVARNYSLAMLFMTPMVLVLGAMGPHISPEQLILDRALETLIGGVIAVLGILFLMWRYPDHHTKH